MRQYLAILFLAISNFFSGVQAREIEFVFHLQPPAGLPAKDQFLYVLRPGEQTFIEVRVDIPGLPVVRQGMVYIPYAEPAPGHWMGQTIVWYDENDCSTVNVHVAIRGGGARLSTVYNEIFQLGFRAAIAHLGVDACQTQKKGTFLFFMYAGRQWTDNQLEEAASEIGTIRAATKLGRPQIVEKRFAELMNPNFKFEPYALIQFLIKRAGSDPKKYEEELKLVVESFLDRHRPKK